MRHLFIINPHSFADHDDITAAVSGIPRYFMKIGGQYKMYTSRYPRDAVAVVHHYLEQVPQDETVRVYAVGGDGILFDCLNGVAGFPNAQLTNIPYGKSNNFIRVFGPDAKPRFRDLPALINGTPHVMDVIDCGTNYALNHVSIGLEAKSVLSGNAFLRKTQSRWVKPFAGLVYSVNALLLTMQTEVMGQWYRVNVDGEDHSGRYFAINIANGACSTRPLVPSPRALPNDGLLNLSFSKTDRYSKMLRVILQYTRGKLARHKDDINVRLAGGLIKITSNNPIHVHFDGEAFTTYALRLEVVKDAVNFFAPEGMHIVDYAREGGRRP